VVSGSEYGAEDRAFESAQAVRCRFFIRCKNVVGDNYAFLL
jgi:hypothetical protein